MKTGKRGFTLMEMIVALALIGIVAAGLIPAFAAQFKMTLNTRNLTTQSFDAQGEMENVIYELKNSMVDPRLDASTIDGVEVIEKTIFGKNVYLYSLRKGFPLNSNKDFIVFLSKKLADMELRQLLVASGVRIKVNGGSHANLADLTINPKPWLEGMYDSNPDKNWYANIYEWYRSKEGNPNPVFPGDFEKIIFAGKTPDELTDLSKHANRYIVFTVTPVDIHGVRGNEVRSSNTVYVLGEEWRTGVFAWVDKDANGSYSDKVDVPVDKKDYWTWPLVKGFDGANKFTDPINPGVGNDLDPSDGSLYVPMGIDRGASTNGVITIQKTGTDKIDWIMDKNINLAADIIVNNDSDVRMATRDGNIIVYQYIKLSSSGDAEFGSDGLAKLINKAPEINASGGNILFEMEGRGDIVLQDYSKLIAGKGITLMPFGHINIFKSTLEAKESILLDSTRGSTFPGNRDITINDSTLKLLPASAIGRNISISTKDKLTISNTTFTNSASGRSDIVFAAPGGISLSEVDFNNFSLYLDHNTLMKGGGWDSDTLVRVADDRVLTLGNGINKVNNNGSLVLGDTGGVKFLNGNSENLKNELRLTLDRRSSNQVTISTNYGRNLNYADSSDFETASFRSYQSLGSGQNNLKYMVTKSSGGGNPTISCAYNGEGVITVKAGGISETAYTSYYELSVQDRYAIGVTGTIRIKVQAAANGSPSVDIVAPTVTNYKVTFNSNGGSAVSPSTKNVKLGEMIGSFPPPPTKAGFYFGGWTTELNGEQTIKETYIVTDDITLYAKWRTVPLYKVLFHKNDDSYPNDIHHTKYVEWGEKIGALPGGPFWTDSYIFNSWNTSANGGGTRVTDSMIIKADTDVYAIYDYIWNEERWQVTFNKNGGDTEANPKLMLAFKEEPLGSLPEPPTRTGYGFTGWNTRSDGKGSTFNEKTIVSSAITVYAQWKKGFSTINKGQYVRITVGRNDYNFQKIGDNELLARARDGNNANWNNAVTRANNYKNTFSTISWVTGSSLITEDLLNGISSVSAGTRRIDSTYKTSDAWWGPSYSNNNAYYVTGGTNSSQGNVNNQSKNTSNNMYVRPVITVDTTNLYIESGSGTSNSPYVLVWE